MWRHDFATRCTDPIALGRKYLLRAVWSPTGEELAFASDREGSNDIFSVRLDGTRGAPRKLVGGKAHQEPFSWTPDGRVLLFGERDEERRGATCGYGGRERSLLVFLASRANEARGAFAPDGRWVAYQSDESGSSRSTCPVFPGAQSKRRVSLHGGHDPRWNPNGRELFYRSAGGS